MKISKRNESDEGQIPIIDEDKEKEGVRSIIV